MSASATLPCPSYEEKKKKSSKKNACIRQWNSEDVNFQARQNIFAYSLKT